MARKISLHDSLTGFTSTPPGAQRFLKSRGFNVRSTSMYTSSELNLTKSIGEPFQLVQYFELRTCVIYRLDNLLSDTISCDTHQVCFFCKSSIRAYATKAVAIDDACELPMDDRMQLKHKGAYHTAYYYDVLRMHKDIAWANGELKSSKGQLLPICTCCRSFAMLDTQTFKLAKDDPTVRLFEFSRTYLDNTIQQFFEYHMRHSTSDDDDDDDVSTTEPESDPSQEAVEDNQVVLYGSQEDPDEDTPYSLPAASWSSFEIQSLITSMSQ